MFQISVFYTFTRDNMYGGVPLPHPPPLGVQYMVSSTPCTEIIIHLEPFWT